MSDKRKKQIIIYIGGVLTGILLFLFNYQR